MRGKVQAKLHRGILIRITPAYAGKSLPCFAGFIQSQDHPRLCGEKTGAVALYVTWRGSPPPMRGKVLAVLVFYLPLGITPAYAGKRICLKKSV